MGRRGSYLGRLLPALILGAAPLVFSSYALQPVAPPRLPVLHRRACSPVLRLRTAAEAFAAEQFVAELNAEHADELRRLVRQKNDADGVDWSVERMESVRLLEVDDDGLHLEEILCSSQDERCMAVEIPIPWSAGSALPSSGDDVSGWRKAFTEVSRKAYAAIYDNAIPPEYEAQQAALNGMMRYLNGEQGELLKYYALRHGRAAFSPTEQLERARLTQLTYEGLSLEVETLELLEQEASIGGRATNRSPRKRWSVALLFARPCADPEEVETSLIEMLARDDASSDSSSDLPGPDQRSAAPPATPDAAAAAAAQAQAQAEEAAKVAWLAEQDALGGDPLAQAPTWGVALAPAPAAAPRDAAIAPCAEWGEGTGVGGGELTRDPELDPEAATQRAQRADQPASGHPQRWRRRE